MEKEGEEEKEFKYNHFPHPMLVKVYQKLYLVPGTIYRFESDGPIKPRVRSDKKLGNTNHHLALKARLALH